MADKWGAKEGRDEGKVRFLTYFDLFSIQRDLGNTI